MIMDGAIFVSGTRPGRDPPRQARGGTRAAKARAAARSAEAETGYLEPSGSSLSRDEPRDGAEKELTMESTIESTTKPSLNR
jgi:hypothetical protein